MQTEQIFQNVLPTRQPQPIIGCFEHLSQSIYISFTSPHVVVLVQWVINIYPR